MLETLAVLLIVFWLLGLLTSYTLGGLIHLLLVIATMNMLLRCMSDHCLAQLLQNCS